MRKELGQVLDSPRGLAFDPGGRCLMATGPLGARDLGVGDVAHKRMPEGVLRLAFHRTHARGADELLARELVQRLVNLAWRAPAHRGKRARPEDLADDRG